MGERAALLVFLLVVGCDVGSESGLRPLDGQGGNDGLSLDAPCDEAEAPFWCVPSCAERPQFLVPVCEVEKWECPAGAVVFSTCPPESCAGRNVACCDRATGKLLERACGDDGMFEACPDGAAPTQSSCKPESVGEATCGELDGVVCASRELECHTDRCGPRCTCEPDTDGVLRFSCVVPVC